MGEPTTTVKVSGADLRAFFANAKAANNLEAWCDCAMQWMIGAEQELAASQREREQLQAALGIARNWIMNHRDCNTREQCIQRMDEGICTAALRYLKLRDGNRIACYTVPPDDNQPGVRISGPALDAEVDK